MTEQNSQINNQQQSSIIDSFRSIKNKFLKQINYYMFYFLNIIQLRIIYFLTFDLYCFFGDKFDSNYYFLIVKYVLLVINDFNYLFKSFITRYCYEIALKTMLIMSKEIEKNNVEVIQTVRKLYRELN